MNKHKCKVRFPGVLPKEIVGFDAAPLICSSLMLVASIDLALLDGLAFNAVTKQGLLKFTQAAIDIGKNYGRVDASKILPCRTSVSRGVQARANSLRDKKGCHGKGYM